MAPRIDSVTKALILFSLKARLPMREIARGCKVSLGAVHYLAKRGMPCRSGRLFQKHGRKRILCER